MRQAQNISYSAELATGGTPSRCCFEPPLGAAHGTVGGAAFVSMVMSCPPISRRSPTRLGRSSACFRADCDGDVLAAQRALMRLLKSNGCDIHGLADSIGTGKQFSEADVAKIYRRGVEDGRRAVEHARDAPAFHDVEGSWESMVSACADQLNRFSPRAAIYRNTAALARRADAEATQLARRPV